MGGEKVFRFQFISLMTLVSVALHHLQRFGVIALLIIGNYGSKSTIEILKYLHFRNFFQNDQLHA